MEHFSCKRIMPSPKSNNTLLKQPAFRVRRWRQLGPYGCWALAAAAHGVVLVVYLHYFRRVRRLSMDATMSCSASLRRFIDGFRNHIRPSMENAIKNKVMEGALKFDYFLGNLPKKIDLDTVAAMNVTLVNDPIFKSSSVEFDIDGLFIPSDETALRNMLLGDTQFALPLGSS